MKKNGLMIIILMLVLLPFNVSAKSKTDCDYGLLSSMKQYASNVNIIYDYYLKDNNAYFNVTINNLTSNMYVVDEVTGSKYYFSDTNNGELIIRDYKDVETLKYKIYSNNSECMDEVLIIQYITLPVYNKYSTDPLCEGISDYQLCHRFLKTNISYEEFKKQVTEYKTGKEKEVVEDKKEVKDEMTFVEKLIDFAKRFGILFVILIVGLIVYIVKQRKKNRFDFKL